MFKFHRHADMRPIRGDTPFNEQHIHRHTVELLQFVWVTRKHAGLDRRGEWLQLLSRLCRSTIAVMCIGIIVGFIMGSNVCHDRRSKSVSSPSGAVPACADDLHVADNALVVYSFYDGDEVSWDNLVFFLDHAMSPRDGAQYVVVLNGMRTLSDARLPQLPSNARYVLHENECYDWGTYAWVLDTVIDSSVFKYILFINSSVRGPLLPWYASGQHWTRIFTQKINDQVKLVGPSVSCEHFCLMEQTPTGMQRRGCRRNAHVQSVAVATDQVGLRTLRDSGYVLRCHKDRFEAVYYGEIGASLSMFEAGYTIDSFLTRYQGVNWRGEVNWECNHALSPIGKRTFDGLTLSAFEAVFPKLKGSLLESGLPSHFEALKMSQWLTTPVSKRNITGNWFATDGDQVKAEDMIIAEYKGQECFDWDYYKKKNPDVATMPQNKMWRHFLTRGAVEFREHRWKCVIKSEDVLRKLSP